MTRLIRWTSVCSFTFAAIMAGSALFLNVAPALAQTVFQCISCGNNCCELLDMPCSDPMVGGCEGCEDCNCKPMNNSKYCATQS